MRRKDVLAILDGTIHAVKGKAAGVEPVTFLKTDEVEKCVVQLMKLRASVTNHTRPLTLDPMQLPPMF